MNPSYSPSLGRIEVFYNGTWGTICDDSWDTQDAEVVCRQLGYDGALSAPHAAPFGRGTGQIWLDDVQCVGKEISISECYHRGWGDHNCWHGEDAGVVCRPKGTTKRYNTSRIRKTSLLSLTFEFLLPCGNKLCLLCKANLAEHAFSSLQIQCCLCSVRQTWLRTTITTR